MEKLTNFWNKTNRWHRLGAIFLLAELNVLPQSQYGFTCNDPDLSYPFEGDTVGTKDLFSSVLLIPVLVLLLTERFLSTEKSDRWKQQALFWYKEYLFGLLLNMTLIAIVKSIMGMPRPHFFDTCSPKEAETCQGSEYVARYTCLKSGWVTQSDRSFPSGHAALGVHAAIFIALYLRRRITRNSVSLCAQLVCWVLALLMAWSRVWDRRHHARDALAGAALAAPVLAYTVISLCKNFETDPQVESPAKENEEESENKLKS